MESSSREPETETGDSMKETSYRISKFRFYFENPGIFTRSQMEELKKTSLSRIICDNADNFELVSQDAFLLPGSQLTPCRNLPEMDLSKWRAI